MDSRFRNLWRRYWNTRDGSVAGSLYRAMLASASSLNNIVALRDDLDEQNVELLREISQYLYSRGIPYPTPRDWTTRKFDYRNPPPGAGSWALVEFNETRYWTDRIKDQVIAVTGVYLVDTQRRVHIASMTPSAELSSMYPNVIYPDYPDDDGENDRNLELTEEIEQEWYAAAEIVEYRDFKSLGSAVGWHWIPDDLIMWQDEDYDETLNELRDYYLGNRAL